MTDTEKTNPEASCTSIAATGLPPRTNSSGLASTGSTNQLSHIGSRCHACISLYCMQMRLQHRQTVQCICRSKQIQIRQCRCHTGGYWRIVLPTLQGVKPDEPATPALEPRQRFNHELRWICVVPIGKDNDNRPTGHGLSCVLLIEALQVLSDTRAATEALRHQ